jgi:hypothetical protein
LSFNDLKFGCFFIYNQAVLKFLKLDTQTQQREAVVQGRSLSPIPVSVYPVSVYPASYSPTQRKNFTSTGEHRQNSNSHPPNVNYREKIHQLSGGHATAFNNWSCASENGVLVCQRKGYSGCQKCVSFFILCFFQKHPFSPFTF